MKDHRRVGQLLSIMLLIWIAACHRESGPTAEPATPRAWVKDEWVRFPPPDLWHANSAEMPYREVGTDAQADAESRLATQPFALLDARELRAILASDDTKIAGVGMPVLLRAVRTKGDGSRSIEEDIVQVLWRDGAVSVQTYGERDRPGLPQERFAIVAWLPRAPDEVYVSDSTVIIGGIDDHD